jgi:hypothetical protein
VMDSRLYYQKPEDSVNLYLFRFGSM